jgi:hypothetical protein
MLEYTFFATHKFSKHKWWVHRAIYVAPKNNRICKLVKEFALGFMSDCVRPRVSV